MALRDEDLESRWDGIYVHYNTSYVAVCVLYRESYPAPTLVPKH
jgi:hypothetical protein